MLLELIADLQLQGDARIKHDAQEPDDGQLFVQVGVHLLDGVDQVGQSFEREVFALHGHDDAVRAAQAIEREHGQGRRAIDEDKVILVCHRLDGQTQTLFAALDLDQLDLGAGQFAVGAQHVVAATGVHQFLAGDTRFGDRGGLQQHVINRELQLALVHARAHGGVALRIQVDHQHALAELRQTCREIDGGGGLAHPALLVGNAKYFGHGCLL